MLATLGGILALIVGLALLLLPVALSELSRPRDSVWGAVVLLLGLVLVTSSERLTGAPMLAVLCGGLLIGRLGTEVAQGRWRQLSPEEQTALRSSERWLTSLNQLLTIAAQLLAAALSALATVRQAVQRAVAQRQQPRSSGKRWIRQEASPGSATAPMDGSATAEAPRSPVAGDADGNVETTPAEIDETSAEATAETAAEAAEGETTPESRQEAAAPPADPALATEQPMAEPGSEADAGGTPAQALESLELTAIAAAADAADGPDAPSTAIPAGSEPPEQPIPGAADAGPDAVAAVGDRDDIPGEAAAGSPDRPTEPAVAGDGDGPVHPVGEPGPEPSPAPAVGAAESEPEAGPDAMAIEAAADPVSDADPQPLPTSEPLRVIESFEEIDALLDRPISRPASPEAFVDVEVEELGLDGAATDHRLIDAIGTVDGPVDAPDRR